MVRSCARPARLISVEEELRVLWVSGFLVACVDALEASSVLLVGGVVEGATEETSPSSSRTVMQERVEADGERVISRRAIAGDVPFGYPGAEKACSTSRMFIGRLYAALQKADTELYHVI